MIDIVIEEREPYSQLIRQAFVSIRGSCLSSIFSCDSWGVRDVCSKRSPIHVAAVLEGGSPATSFDQIPGANSKQQTALAVEDS